jgi:hypothetical protein
MKKKGYNKDWNFLKGTWNPKFVRRVRQDTKTMVWPCKKTGQK